MAISLPCYLVLLADLLPSAKKQADTSEEQYVGREDPFTQTANPKINKESLHMSHTHSSEAPIRWPPDTFPRQITAQNRELLSTSSGQLAG